jgi:acetyltransferase-like isoleucine patch superfamily enzyme
MRGHSSTRLRRRLGERLDLWLRERVEPLVSECVGRELAAEREGELTRPRRWGPDGRVRIAASAVVNDALLNTVSGSITVEEHAFFGHGVALLTGTHDVARLGLERQRAVPADGRDIVVGRGAWVSSRAIVLGPCRIGANAVVAAGAVVTADVPPGAIVAGNPARVVGRVD